MLGSLSLGVAAASIRSAMADGTKLNYGFGGTAVYYFPHYIADAAGYYKQEGADYDVVTLTSGARMTAATMGGSVDMTLMGASQIIAANDKGGGLISIASAYDVFSMALVMSNDAMKRLGITPDMSTDDKVKRMKGIKVGITSPASSSDQLIRTLFVARGMNPDKQVDLVPLGQGESMLAALEKGLVDGFVFSPPFGAIAEAKGIGHTVVDPFNHEVPELDGGTYIVLATAPSTLQNNRSGLRGTVRALTRAIKLAQTDPAKVKVMVRPYFSDVDDTVYNAMFDKSLQAVSKTPVLSRKQFDGTVTAMNIIAKTPSKPNFDSVVNNELATEAAKDILGA